MTARALAVACFALAALALAGAACGGDSNDPSPRREAVTIEGYFQSLEALSMEADARAADLQLVYPDAFEQQPTARDYMEALTRVFRDIASKAAEIEAPPEVAAAHEEYVAAIVAFADLGESYAEAIAGARTPEQFAQVTRDNRPLADEVNIRYTNACTALQDLAAENGVGVSIVCP